MKRRTRPKRSSRSRRSYNWSRDTADPGAGRRRSSMQVFGRIASLLTLAIAVLGAVTGTISFSRSQAVDLVVSPTGPYVGPKAGVRAIPLTVVNDSERTVNLLHAEVWYAGRRLGFVYAVTEGEAGGADQVSERRPLPRTLHAGEGFAGSLVWRIVDRGLAKRMLRDRQQEVCISEFDPYKTTCSRPQVRLELRLRFKPGGDKTFTTAATHLKLPEMQELAPKFFLYRKRVRFAFTIGRGRRVRAIIVFMSPRPGLVRLRIWDKTGVVAQSAAPVIGTGALPENSIVGRTPEGIGIVDLPVPNLPTGKYLFDLRGGGRVVGTGLFTVPCKRLDAEERAAIRKGHLVSTGACATRGTVRSVGKAFKP